MPTSRGLPEPPVATRDALEQEIRQLLSDARILAAGRRYFRSHPWLFCGAAAALGFVVVPRGAAAPSPVVDGDQADVAGGHFAKEVLALTLASVVEQSAAQLFELGRQVLARRAKSESAPSPPPGSSPSRQAAEANSQPRDEEPQPETMEDKALGNGKPEESPAARLEERLEETLTEHPASALLAAAAAGLLLGWAAKR